MISKNTKHNTGGGKPGCRTDACNPAETQLKQSAVARFRFMEQTLLRITVHMDTRQKQEEEEEEGDRFTQTAKQLG